MGKNFSASVLLPFRAGWLILCCLLAVHPAAAAEIMRPAVTLDGAWHFRFGGDAAAALAGEVAAWPAVTVPHTWNAADGADGGGDYARGAGWYVRRFRLDPSWAGRRVILECEGASRVATVYLNGTKIGEHAGAFARFRFDLTEALRPEGDNLLAVQVSNAADGLAPVSADFTFFGGLYRSVRLFAVDPLHVEVLDCAADGVFVTPRQVTAARAEFSVAVNLRNETGRAAQVVLRLVLRDAAGTVVGDQALTTDIPAHGNARAEQAFVIEHPHLWNGRADPHQYRVEVAVSEGGRIRDRVEQRFGLRFYGVDAEKGFSLNGVPLDLHGVSRHQDRAGKGWAIGAADDREDFALIAELGATALRVAHYPQSALWFDLADERGLVVWAEIPVVNEVPATEAYAANARQQLRELIRQNYNRPAICFWGVGNETREDGETKVQQPNGPVSDRLIAELTQLAHAEDPMRLNTYASHHRAEDVRNFHTEVLGFNKYLGWYGGTMQDFATWADDVHRRFPALRFAMSEYGAGANIAQHDLSLTKPQPGGAWHPEEYQARFHEIYWRALEARPYIWGKFIWNLFDFAADIRAEGAAPGMNDKGLVTYDRRTRKDAFYFYQASWSATPVLHLNSRRYTARPAGPTEITAYSNLAAAELFLNGVSCGKINATERVLRWPVVLTEGKNTLVVRALSGVTPLSDECIFTCPPLLQPASAP
jgi:beta-galactosidase